MKLFNVKQGTPIKVVVNKPGSDTEFAICDHITRQDNLFEIEEMVLDVIPDSQLNDTSNRNAGAIVVALTMRGPVYAFRRGQFVAVIAAGNVEVW